MERTDSCKDCYFYFEDKAGGAVISQCRRNAPVVLHIPSRVPSGDPGSFERSYILGLFTAFPETEFDGWCGRFLDRKKAPGLKAMLDSFG